MQQELIEMLEKVVDHVVFCNGHDQRFSSTSCGVNILKEAGVLIEKAKNTEPAQEVGLTDRQFDLICQAIDKADTVTMEGDYMLDSDDCIRVVRAMQVLFDIAALRAKENKL